MKNILLILGIIALSVAGIMIIGIVSRYSCCGVDQYLIYYSLGMIGSLISGINLVLKSKTITKSD